MEEKKGQEKRRSPGMSPLDDPNEKYFFMETTYGGLARVPESKMGVWLEQQEKIKRGEVKPDEELTKKFLESVGYDPTDDREPTEEEKKQILWVEEWYRQKEEEFRRREEARMKHSVEERQLSEE